MVMGRVKVGVRFSTRVSVSMGGHEVGVRMRGVEVGMRLKERVRVIMRMLI